MKPNEDNVKIKLNDKPKRRTDDPFALFVSMFADFLVQEIGPLSDSLTYLYRWVLKGMLTLPEYRLQFELGFPFYFGTEN